MANILSNLEQVKEILNGVVEILDSGVKILDEKKLRETVIDDLIYTAVFSKDYNLKEEVKYVIREISNYFGAVASSIHDL